MRKLIAMILCICILCPFGFTWGKVLAATAPVTLFDCDFEEMWEEDNVADHVKKNEINKWTEATLDKTKPVVKVDVAYESLPGNFARFYTEDTEKNRGPRLAKTFYFEETLENLTVSYKFKTVDTTLTFALYFGDGTSQKFLSETSEGWSEVKLEFDFKASTYVYYLNGVKSKEGPIKYNDITSLSMRLSANIKKGEYAYLDDVKVTTTSPVDVEACNKLITIERTPEEIIEGFNAYSSAPLVSLPEGKYRLFYYDCSLNADNSIPTSTEAQFTKKSNASQAVLKGDKIIRFTNAASIKQSAFLQKKLLVGTNTKQVTAEYYAVLSDSAMYPVLLDNTGKEMVSLKNYAVSKNSSGFKANDWNKIKVVFDIENSRASMYLNDAEVVKNVAFSSAMPKGSYELIVQLNGALVKFDTILLDNFIMYQDARPVMDGIKYYGTTGTTWSMVASDVVLKDDSMVKNLRQHPRILFNDVKAFKAKIESDPASASWAASLIKEADKALTAEVYEYAFGNGRNILDVARHIGDRLWYLGFAYLMTGEEKYVERGVEEMRNAATFPDWSNSAPIIPSEIMLGFAGFYDWCYHSETMTDEVKAEMIQIVKDQALWQFVRSYDGVISAEIAGGKTNRTTVSNSAAIMFALAVADEEQKLSQFLIDNALVYMQAPTNAYGVDGAYPEGASYWGYPMRTLTPALSSIQSAVKADYILPAAAQWYFEHEALNKTLDYWAYTSGSTALFDFGDASPGLGATPAIFWFAQNNNDLFSVWFAKHTQAKKGGSVSEKYFAIPWYDPEFDAYNNGKPLDKTFDGSPNAQIASMRSSWTANDALYAAIQGGYNGTSHMFKSLGTFVIDSNGKRFVRAIGRSDYSALDDTYKYYNERAEGQNTLVANPQKATNGFDQNTTAYATFKRHEEAKNEAFTVLDMTDTNTDFVKAERGMYMTKGRRSIVLQDEVEMKMPSELWWFAHTGAEIYITEEGKAAILCVGSEKMYVKITSGPADAVFTVMKARPLPTSPVAMDETYRNMEKLAIHMSNVTKTTLTVEFVPIEAMEAVPQTFTEVKPISQWKVSDNTVSLARQAGYVLAMMQDSPNALVFEERRLLDKNDAAAMPQMYNGVLMIPAKAAAEAVFAKTTVSSTKVEVTRNYQTNTITEGIVKIGDAYYVPAQALATALGMQMYTDESGLIVFSDRAIDYSDELKAALATELKTRVLINTRDFVGFTTDKTDYYIAYSDRKPAVTVNNAKVTKTADAASFELNGKTYTLHYVESEDEFSKFNVLGGVIPTANIPLGNSYIPAHMTDGTDESCATISLKPTDVTYTLKLGGMYYIDEFELEDQIVVEEDKNLSIMETAKFTGMLADGTWIELGTMADLTSGDTSGKIRVNTLEVKDKPAVQAIRMQVKSTDDYTNRYYVTELSAQGSVCMDAYTETSYVEKEGTLTFTTKFYGSVPQSGCLYIALYKEGKLCGVVCEEYKATKSSGYIYWSDVKTTAPAVDFDTAKVMLIDSFATMKFMTEPEILQKQMR